MGQVAHRVVGEDGVDVGEHGFDIGVHGCGGAGLRVRCGCGCGKAVVGCGSSDDSCVNVDELRFTLPAQIESRVVAASKVWTGFDVVVGEAQGSLAEVLLLCGGGSPGLAPLTAWRLAFHCCGGLLAVSLGLPDRSGPAPENCQARPLQPPNRTLAGLRRRPASEWLPACHTDARRCRVSAAGAARRKRNARQRSQSPN